MKKRLLQLTFILLPFFALAQDDVPVLNDISKDVRDIKTTFKLNDHVWIMQNWLPGDNSELIAIDDKMQVLWRSKFEGHPIGAGKFKDHILVLTDSKYSLTNDRSFNPYIASLIDEKTGNLLTKKVIYNDKSDMWEFPSVYFNEDGSSFTFVVAQAKKTKVVHWMGAKPWKIETLNVVKIDDDLNATITKLQLPDEVFAYMECNNQGDLFLITRSGNDKLTKVTKYNAPKYDGATAIVQNISLQGPLSIINNHVKVITSSDNRNITYIATAHLNQNKENELTVCKFDFANHTAKAVNEVFNKSHVQEMKNAYVPFDSNLQTPIVEPEVMEEMQIKEWKDKLVVIFQNSIFRGEYPSHTSYSDGGSLIINCYDKDLNTNFRQIMPTYGFTFCPAHESHNSLYVLGNTKDGKKYTGLYGQLDLESGKWLKMRKLPPGDYQYVMWYTERFILPKVFHDNVSLQLNKY